MNYVVKGSDKPILMYSVAIWYSLGKAVLQLLIVCIFYLFRAGTSKGEWASF